jgi:hypothetical protein
MEDMSRTIKRINKRALSWLMVIAIIISMVTGAGVTGTAATMTVFSVVLSGVNVSGIDIQLVNADNNSEKSTVKTLNGEALFVNFVDSNKTYNIYVKGAEGYEDYTEYAVTFGSTNAYYIVPSSLSVYTVSGKVKYQPTTGLYAPFAGAVISYAYNSVNGSIKSNATTDADGNFSFNVYSGKTYDITVSGGVSYTVYNTQISSIHDNYTLPDVTLKKKDININTYAGSNGTITPSGLVAYGESYPVTITANAGYQISSIKVDSVSIAISDPHQVTLPMTNLKASVSVVAAFAKESYDISFAYNAQGQITDQTGGLIEPGGSISPSYGTSPKFTATANVAQGYHIASVKIDGSEKIANPNENSNVSFTYTFPNINSAHTVEVLFVINKYTVTLSSNTHGRFTYNGYSGQDIIQIEHGSDAIVEIIPDQGYIISSLKINDNEAALDDPAITEKGDGSYAYALNGITSNQIIYADFGEIPMTQGAESTYYTLNFTKTPDADHIKTESDGTKVYILAYDAQASILPVSPYTGIQQGASPSYPMPSAINITSTTTVSQLIVKRSTGAFAGAIQRVSMKPIRIVIDKASPTVDTATGSDWTRNAVTVTGTATDTGGAGLHYIRYSKSLDDYSNDTYTGSSAGLAELNGKNFSFVVPNTASVNDTYYIWAYDMAGNKSATYRTVQVKIDVTAPDVTEFQFKKLANSTNSRLISFLTFGTFYNEEFEVTVSAKDTGIASGVKYISLYANGQLLERKASTNGSASFILPDTLYEATLSARAEDVAGNISAEKKPTEVLSNANSNVVSIETVKPVVTITPAEPDFVSTQTQKWYKNDVPINIDVSDVDSGIGYVEIILNGTSLGTDINGRSINAQFSKTKTNLEHFTISTSQSPLDGRNVIEVKVYDNCGNLRTESVNVYKDTTTPVITNFQIKAHNSSAAAKAVNFLTFGTFFNEKVDVVVKVEDRGASSGVATVTLYGDGAPIFATPKPVTRDNEAVFELPAEYISSGKKHLDKTLSAIATDNVGNHTPSPVMPNTVNSDIKNSRLMIETVEPEASIVIPDPVYSSEDGKNWYSKDIDFQLEAIDEDSGIRTVEVYINGVALTADKLGKSINESFFNKETHREPFVVNSSQGAIAEDGSINLTLTVTDNAGNVKTSSKKIYRDLSVPYIIGFTFAAAGSKEANAAPSVEEKDYGYFFPTESYVTISARDDEPSSGLKSITYYTQDISTGRKAEIVAEVNANNEISFLVPANFKGQIYAKPTDRTGNTPENYVTPNSAIIETAAKHAEEEHIIFTLPETSKKDAKGNPLYNADVELTLGVADTYSGLRTVEWSVSSPNDSSKNQGGRLEIKNDKSLTEGSSGAGWQLVKSDKNLVTTMSNKLKITNNSNSIVVKATITDRAGNTSTKDITISIDKTVPTIAVTYDNNTSDEKFAGYYKAARKATIVVTERNFRPEDTVVTILNASGSVPAISKWTAADNASNPDLSTYTATVDFAADGNYTFDIACRDAAGNAAAAFTTQKFIVDKSQPLIKVAYDNLSSGNGNYYKKTRTATVTITEANFETSRIVIKGKATNDGNAIKYPVPSEWVSRGDMHTATITYSEDAKYIFDISYTDKAGNLSSPYSPDEFYIDTTAPTITIEGVADKSANRGEVIPIVSCSDTNFDKNLVQLSLIGVVRGSISYIGGAKDVKNGQAYAFDSFPVSREVDDIYTLRAEATDLAGNKTEQTIKFSVNRFGSVYEFNDYLTSLQNSYNQKVDDQLVITEYNPDKLLKDSLVIEITKDGAPLREVLYNSTLTSSDVAAVGSTGWYQYEYAISPDNFKEDGVYKVSVSTEDAAGNYPELSKDKEITFSVDTVSPELTNITGLEKKSYNSAEITVNFEAFDAIGMKSIKAYVNDVLVQEFDKYENPGIVSGSFNIGTGMNQRVRLVMEDMAGNITDTDTAPSAKAAKFNHTVTVSTNLFIRWYANKWLFWGSIAGAGVLTLGLAALFIVLAVLRKKKRLQPVTM